jgi:hypothetical protein
MPMIFFVSLGCMQCSLALMEKNQMRLALGMALLFGAAMCKFEGVLFFAIAAGWILLIPSARPSLKFSARLWPVIIFCVFIVLPFICLRAQIPVLNYESHWMSYMKSNPALALTNAPKIFLMLLARLFVNPNFANWSNADGTFHWTGKWEGLLSLYHNLGIGWMCILLSIAVWFALPSRRYALIWIIFVFASAVAVMSLVFSSFISIRGSLDRILFTFTADAGGGRYLFPMLWAWAAAVLTILFAEPSTPKEIISNNSN